GSLASTESSDASGPHEVDMSGHNNVHPHAEAFYNQFHLTGHYIGYFRCDGGLPCFTEKGLKWISSRTGGSASCSRLAQLGAAHQMPCRTLTYNLPVIDLPHRVITERLLLEFKGSVFGLVFLVVDHVLFIDILDLAYQPNDGQVAVERILSSACVLAFLSVAPFFGIDSTDDAQIDTALCAAITHRFLSGLQKGMSATSLQTVLLLYFHQMLCGHMNLASKLLAVACRMALSRGGHVSPPVGSTGENLSREERESRHLQPMTWLCYTLDKDTALRTGLPPILSDQLCGSAPPEDYEKLHSKCQSDMDRGARIKRPAFHGDVRLGMLKVKIVHTLYSKSASTKPEAELLRTLREIDEELEEWRVSPSALSSRALHFQRISAGFNMRHILLHLEYHYLITAIHRVSARYSLGTLRRRKKHGSKQGVQQP
ncbi:hypothetical protein B0T10DRAFT_416169, partial [Thelonectria olida]